MVYLYSAGKKSHHKAMAKTQTVQAPHLYQIAMHSICLFQKSLLPTEQQTTLIAIC